MQFRNRERKREEEVRGFTPSHSPHDDMYAGRCRVRHHCGALHCVKVRSQTMAKVVCVIYDDPVDGYPKTYARGDL